MHQTNSRITFSPQVALLRKTAGIACLKSSSGGQRMNSDLHGACGGQYGGNGLLHILELSSIP